MEQAVKTQGANRSITPFVRGQHHAPAILPSGKGPGTHCTGDSVGPRASAENLAVTRIRSLDRRALPTTLSRPTVLLCMFL
jgi:hypothetical protein